MGEIVAWLKENVKKGHLKDVIRTHTGLSPPAFFAAVAAAAAATAFTVSVVSSFLSPSQKRDMELEDIIEEEIMPYSESRDAEPVHLTEETLERDAELELERAEMAALMGDGVDTISSDFMEEEAEEEKLASMSN